MKPEQREGQVSEEPSRSGSKFVEGVMDRIRRGYQYFFGEIVIPETTSREMEPSEISARLKAEDMAYFEKDRKLSAEKKILIAAAEKTRLIGHGTGMVSYKTIIKSGALIHTKGFDYYGSLYAKDPPNLDDGNGLFVMASESSRFLEPIPGGRRMPIDRILWIVLPSWEVEQVRKQIQDGEETEPNLLQHQSKILSYQEAADEIPKNPRFRYDFNKASLTPEDREKFVVYKAQALNCVRYEDEANARHWINEAEKIFLGDTQLKFICRAARKLGMNI